MKLALLDKMPFAGGSILARIPEWEDGQAELTFEGDSGLALAVDRTVEWFDQALYNRIIWHEDDEGTERDWVISDVQDGLDARALIRCDPPAVLLAKLGPIADTTAGGTTSYDVSWTDETPSQIYDRIIAPWLTARGVDAWITKGTFDPTDILTGDFGGVPATAQELMVRLAADTGARFTFERGATSYTINLRTTLAPSTAEAKIARGSNLETLIRSRSGEDVATAIITRGSDVGGQRAAVGDALWEVSEVLNPVASTIAHDGNSGIQTGSAGVGTISWTHTPSGTLKAVVVLIAHWELTDRIQSVTYGGVTMTRQQRGTSAATTEPGSAYAYVLTSGIPSGAQTVVVTLDTGTNADVIDCVSFGFTADNPLYVVASGNASGLGTGVNTSISLTGIGGSQAAYALGALYFGGTAANVSPGSGYTDESGALENEHATTRTNAFEYRTGETTGNVTVDWAHSSDDRTAVALALAEDLTATPYVVLVDPDGGDGPIQLDDQFVANALSAPDEIPTHYLEREDLTYEAITDTDAATGRFYLADASGFTVADLVRICIDSSGTTMQEVHSPTGIATYGRVVRYRDEDSITGILNFETNPLMNDWASEPVTAGMTVVSVGVGTMDVENAPANFAFKSGALILGQDASFLYVQAGVFLNADATANGAGEATLTFTGAAPNFAVGCPLSYHQSGPPDGWTAPGSPNTHTRRPTDSELGDLSGTAVGTQTSVFYVEVQGLTSGDIIRAGDAVRFPDNPSLLCATARHDATVDGSGHVLLSLNTPISYTAGDTVDIVRPLFPAASIENYGQALAVFGIPGAQYVQGPLVNVRHNPAIGKLWASAGVGIRYNGYTTTDPTLVTGSLKSYDPITLGEGATLKPPKIALWNGASEVAELYFESPNSFTMLPGDEDSQILRVAYEMTASGTYAVRFYGCHLVNSSSVAPFTRMDPWGYLLWIELAVTIDPGDAIAPITGQSPVRLHQIANRLLLDRHNWPAEIQATAAELAAAGIKITELGQQVRIEEPGLGIAAVYLVQKLIIPMRRGEPPRYVLARLTPTLWQRILDRIGGAGTAVAAGSAVSGASIDLSAYLTDQDLAPTIATRVLVGV